MGKRSGKKGGQAREGRGQKGIWERMQGAVEIDGDVPGGWSGEGVGPAGGKRRVGRHLDLLSQGVKRDSEERGGGGGGEGTG